MVVSGKKIYSMTVICPRTSSQQPSDVRDRFCSLC